MKFVLLFACYICFVNSIGTFNVSVSVENLCLNIYDHSADRQSTKSQLKMTFYMTSGTTRSQLYYYSSKPYPYITDNFLFNIADNTETGPEALPTSLDRIKLSPSDTLDLVFLVEPVITNSDWPHPVIKCPEKNHLFFESIDPLTILTGVNTSSYNHSITVNMTSLDGCDDGPDIPSSVCPSDRISVLLTFTCPYHCDDLYTTSSTTTSTTTTIKPSTTSYQSSTSTPESPSPGFIVTIVIAAIELMIICVGIYLYLRLRVRALKQTHRLHVEPIPTVEGSGNAIQLEVDGCENGYMPALGHVAPEDRYYEID